MTNWQGEYLSELKRTTGKSGHFEYQAGGWYKLFVPGEIGPSKYQPLQVRVMTRRLRERDSVPSA